MIKNITRIKSISWKQFYHSSQLHNRYPCCWEVNEMRWELTGEEDRKCECEWLNDVCQKACIVQSLFRIHALTSGGMSAMQQASSIVTCMAIVVAVVVICDVTPVITLLILYSSTCWVIPPILRTIPTARTPHLLPSTMSLTWLCSHGKFLQFNQNTRMDNMCGQTKNGTNGVESQFSWLSEKRCANATEGVIEIHENDVLEGVIVDFDPNHFELWFSIDHGLNVNFNWLEHVMDNTVECLSKSDMAAEIWSLELLLEFCESNTAVGLPPEPSVATQAQCGTTCRSWRAYSSSSSLSAYLLCWQMVPSPCKQQSHQTH